MASSTSVNTIMGDFIQKTNSVYTKTGIQIYPQYPHNWQKKHTQQPTSASDNITGIFTLELEFGDLLPPGSGNRVSSGVRVWVVSTVAICVTGSSINFNQ